MKKNTGNQFFVDLLPYEKSPELLVEERVAVLENEGNDDPFVIGDLGDIINKYTDWVDALPRVKPFYAVKCNDDPAVLRVLADLGTNFDCASKGEIEKIMKLGVSPTRIIYAHPCKQASMLKYAAKHDVSLMTFDNEAELYKIKKLYPEAKCVLRILPPSNFKVQCELGIKFGVHPSKAGKLLEIAESLGLNVMGISFHVGSGCEEAIAFAAAIKEAKDVFDQAVSMGFNMELLDIGGGFPGHATAAITFGEIASVVNMALDKYFPAEEGVRIIAEPGRYFVASAFTLGVNIIAKRVVARDQHGDHGELLDQPTACDEPSFMYYVNDGVYGSFNCLMYDHASVQVSTMKDMEESFQFESSVWGPTCDGLDCILEKTPLPEHEVGDWLYFNDMGAYTFASASTFNGMPGPTKSYICRTSLWEQLYPEAMTLDHPKTAMTLDHPKAMSAMSIGRCGREVANHDKPLPSLQDRLIIVNQ